MEIINNLNIPANAYIKIDKGPREGAGKPDGRGRRQTKVPADGGKLEINFNRLPISSLVIYIETDHIPEKDGIEGVKMIPGSSAPPPHHFEFRNLGKKYETVVHYDLSGHDKSKKKKFMTHEDPDIRHPDGKG